jgi:hypothetical protein
MTRTADIYQKWQLQGVFDLFFAKLWAWIRRLLAELNRRFPRLGLGAPGAAARAYNVLRSCLTRGGGRIFATFAYIRNYAWRIFRQGQFSESDQESDQKVAGHFLWSVNRKWTVFLCKCLLVLLWLLILSVIMGAGFASRTRNVISAQEIPNGTEQIIIAGVGIDGSRDDRFVPGEPLSDPDVFGSAVDIAYRRMPHAMEVEAPFEPGAFLPYAEGVPELPSGEPLIVAAYKERRRSADILALLFFPAEELSKLRSENIRQDHLLPVGVVAVAFEDPKPDSPPDIALGVDYVANIQSQYFVFSEACAQGEAEDYVVSEPGLALSCCLEQKPLFKFGQCFGRFRNGIGIVHVIGSFGCLPPDPFRRAFAAKAREPAVCCEVAV